MTHIWKYFENNAVFESCYSYRAAQSFLKGSEGPFQHFQKKGVCDYLVSVRLTSIRLSPITGVYDEISGLTWGGGGGGGVRMPAWAHEKLGSDLGVRCWFSPGIPVSYTTYDWLVTNKGGGGGGGGGGVGADGLTV